MERHIEKALSAALALVGTLVAAQAHAAVYGFDFSENSTDYYFSLDTSMATGGATARANTLFNGVSIYSDGVLLGADNIPFSDISTQTQDPAGGRTLAASGAYTFDFNPANSATRFRTAITFAPGTTVGDDPTRSDVVATLTVMNGAVSGAPEPNAWALMLGGGGAMGLILRRRRPKLARVTNACNRTSLRCSRLTHVVPQMNHGIKAVDATTSSI